MLFMEVFMTGTDAVSADQRRRPFPPLILGLLVLILLAALTATSNYLSFIPREGATGAMRIHWPWWRTFLVNAGEWLALLPFLLIIARVTAAAPLNRQRWRKSLLRHGLAVLVLSPLHFLMVQGLFILTSAAVASWAEALELMAQIPFRVMLSQVFVFPLIYAALAALSYAWIFHRQKGEKEHRAALLEHQLAVAQLRMLRMQLNPHFLFNTLNGIITLMRRDPDTAERMMLALTDFLRCALEEDARLETPLAQELETVARYLAIECLRFPGRIALEKDIQPESLRVPVPAFLLQPLVENAVRHGLAPRASGGQLWIRAHLAEGALHLAVEDDGVGPRDGKLGREGGVGLANTRERLVQRYGARAGFEAGARPEGGFRVALRLPLSTTEALA